MTMHFTSRLGYDQFALANISQLDFINHIIFSFAEKNLKFCLLKGDFLRI